MGRPPWRQCAAGWGMGGCVQSGVCTSLSPRHVVAPPGLPAGQQHIADYFFGAPDSKITFRLEVLSRGRAIGEVGRRPATLSLVVAKPAPGPVCGVTIGYCRPAVEQFTQRVFGLPSKALFPLHGKVCGAATGLGGAQRVCMRLGA